MKPSELNKQLKQNKLWVKGCQFLSSQQKLALLAGDKTIYDVVKNKMTVIKNQLVVAPVDSYSSKIEILTNDLIQKYLPNLGWTFQWKRLTGVYGQCYSSKKVISLSYDLNILVNRDEKNIINTVLHEIAHGIVGTKHGHDTVWRHMALSIGCDGLTLHNDTSVELRYIAHCEYCHRTSHRNKLPGRQTSCGNCSNKFDIKYLLVYKPNPNYKQVTVQRKIK